MRAWAPRQRLSAGGGELGQPRRDQLSTGDHLHVAELTHVEVVARDRGEAGEDVGRALDQAFADDDSLAVVRVPAGTAMRLIDRTAGLFDLQKQRVGAVAPLEQHQEHPHSDAPHADHLARGVDEREAIEQVAAVFRQRGSVGLENLIRQRWLVRRQANPQRWVLDDPQVASDPLGELPDGAGAGSPPRLALDVRGDLLLVLGRKQRDELLGGDQVVPDVQLLRAGVVG